MFRPLIYVVCIHHPNGHEPYGPVELVKYFTTEKAAETYAKQHFGSDDWSIEEVEGGEVSNFKEEE